MRAKLRKEQVTHSRRPFLTNSQAYFTGIGLVSILGLWSRLKGFKVRVIRVSIAAFFLSRIIKRHRSLIRLKAPTIGSQIRSKTTVRSRKDNAEHSPRVTNITSIGGQQYTTPRLLFLCLPQYPPKQSLDVLPKIRQRYQIARNRHGTRRLSVG